MTAHIKTLEAALGAALFERTARGVRLTALGEAAWPAIATAFDTLGLAVASLRTTAAPRVVHIATLPAIAQLWLSPRLPALREAAPEISTSITAMERPPNLKRAPHDLCLFYGATGVVVAEDVIFPVCAPSLAGALHSPSGLRVAGVLIGHEALVAGHLARGALVAPFGERLRLPLALRLWAAQKPQAKGAVDRVIRFLLSR